MLGDGGWLSWNRRAAAWAGLVTLALIAIVSEGLFAERLASVAVVALAIATFLGAIEGIRWRWREVGIRSRSGAQPADSIPYVVGIAVVSGFASQAWFHWGAAIATGDVPPPNGTAWLSRLFMPWAWSGSDLGSPSALEQQLPWAGVIWAVHQVGGSADQAQRIWFAVCFVSAGIACFTLLRAFGIRPIGSLAGSMAYSFSPFVVANLIPNPVVLLAFALLPALPAIVVLGARSTLSIQIAAVLLAVSAPLLGFAYINPPTLGTVLVAVVATPILAGWVYGPPAGRRGLLIVALGGTFAILLSAYWIVPSVFQLHNAAISQLSSVSSWSWTEGRATLRNGLWLNTLWAWAFPEYYPFARTYEDLPLSFLKFAPAALAFGALTIERFRLDNLPDARVGLRLSIAASAVALALIFLGTGTNTPGNVLFDRLYALPFGWLLREPGRFLIVADLMFAILVGLTVQRLVRFESLRQRISKSHQNVMGLVAGLTIAAVIVLPGLPILTGTVVSDSRGSLPSMHVRVPSYWPEMTSFADQMPVQGGILVLPIDDFYQMPYRWGYYGSDAFISQLTDRRILIPGQQTYLSTAPQLLRVEDLVASSITGKDWQLAERLLRLLGTPLVLVRGDVDAAFPGRAIQSPTLLADALEQAPNIDLVHTSGPLWLFRLRAAPIEDLVAAPYVTTIDSATPDLRVLSRLPYDTALLSGPPRIGIASLEEAPSVADWLITANDVSWNFSEDPNLTYSVIQLDSQNAPQPIGEIVSGSTSRSPLHATRIETQGGTGAVKIAITARSVITNGDFRAGPWGPVGDCNAVKRPPGAESLKATVSPAGGPDGAPFIRLSARGDSACEAQQLDWRTGPLLLALDMRFDSGASPRICLWETGPQRCALIPAPALAPGQWESYRAVVTPDPGTTAVAIFLYADGSGSNTQAQADYARVQVLELPFVPHWDILGTPSQLATSIRLEVQHSTYSSSWQGPAGSEHVLVDGLINGWLLVGSQPLLAEYQPTASIEASFVASGVSALVIAGVIAFLVWKRRRRSPD